MKEIKMLIKFDISQVGINYSKDMFVNCKFNVNFKGFDENFNEKMSKEFKYTPFKRGNILTVKKSILVPEEINEETDIKVTVYKAELIYKNGEIYSTEDNTLKYKTTRFINMDEGTDIFIELNDGTFKELEH